MPCYSYLGRELAVDKNIKQNINMVKKINLCVEYAHFVLQFFYSYDTMLILVESFEKSYLKKGRKL